MVFVYLTPDIHRPAQRPAQDAADNSIGRYHCPRGRAPGAEETGDVEASRGPILPTGQGLP